MTQQPIDIFTYEVVSSTLQSYIDKCEKIPKAFRNESLTKYYLELKSLRTKLNDKTMTNIEVFGSLGALNLAHMLDERQRHIDYTKQVVPTYPEGGVSVGGGDFYSLSEAQHLAKERWSEIIQTDNSKNKGEFKHPSKRTINFVGFEAAYSSPEAQEYLRKTRQEIEDYNKNN